MRMRWWPLGSLCGLLLTAPGHARAEEPVTLDEEFLEFLGSLDSDDEIWGQLLASVRASDRTKSDDEDEVDSKQVTP